MPERHLFKATDDRIVFYSVVILVVLASLIALIVIESRLYSLSTNEVYYGSTELSSTTTNKVAPEPFPVSVNPGRKEIVTNPEAEDFISTELALQPGNTNDSWFGKLFASLSSYNWYQNLASVASRSLVIRPGERREEIIKHFGDILGWNEDERIAFSNYVISETPDLEEGKFAPGNYTLATRSHPTEAATVVVQRFDEEVLSRYDTSVAEVVPLEDALIIASLLEREAYDFTDMREISGIIWNRLFLGMKLQIDATLQYAKGSQASERHWWPKVVPADKYIESLYNTYQHPGLPPTPIGNPSVEAIIAALNPIPTDCLFYFHDRNGGFHCSINYEGHVAGLKKHYGRGR